MSDVLDLSARYIDENLYEGPRSVNPTNGELVELAEDVALVQGFSHIVTFRTGDGLVLFDTSLPGFAKRARVSLRAWSDQRVHSVAYTHGHFDHVGGMAVFIEEADGLGIPRPRIIGHENVSPRFDRYDLTTGYNALINARQFAPTKRLKDSMAPVFSGQQPRRFGPREWHHPDTTFSEHLAVRVGDLHFEMHHAKGETDDHLWAWIPERKAVCTGDFVTWVFPNAGNPQKVQRYPLEWAGALRAMAAKEPELLLPAHGLPVAGKARVHQVLDDLATGLELIVEQCLAMMNEGVTLNNIVHAVSLPQELVERPYMRPIYDEPEFIVRNVWRLYGGSYDGNPANLKPAADGELGREVAALAGGAANLGKRALALSEAGDLRLACHIVELAAQAAPEDRAVHAMRAEVYRARRDGELSLMAKGIYQGAVAESAAKAGIDEEI